MDIGAEGGVTPELLPETPTPLSDAAAAKTLQRSPRILTSSSWSGRSCPDR